MTSSRSLVIGTAGHVDHGKTALVHALTGTDTDRLPEEKARGMTIDLGFAALTLKGPDDQHLDLSFIDVPGHHAFLRNMMAGAGGIDCVLLVIAADEGPKPQTLEHLAICGLLGVRRGLVVLTKQDAVTPERLATVRAETGRILEGTFLELAPMLAVSARTGTGLPELKDALLQLGLSLPEPVSESVLRLPLDRVFSIRGFGTVVTGTLHDGSLGLTDAIEIQPGARRTRLRGIQVHNRPVEIAHAPTRVALNLAGVETSVVARGDTVLQPGTLLPVTLLDVLLTGLADAPPIRHRDRVNLYAFTYETEATVLLYNQDTPEAGRFARLRLSTPLVLLPGDAFVLRRRSPAQLLGGGCVVDAHPLPRARKPAVLAWLTRQQGLTPDLQLLARVQRREREGISLAMLVQETGLKAETILSRLTPLLASGRLVAGEHTQPAHFIESRTLEEGAQSILTGLLAVPAHSAPLAVLQSQTGLPAWAFALTLERLLATAPVRRSGAELVLQVPLGPDSAQNSLLARVEERYRSAGLASPLVQEVASKLRIPLTELSPLLTVLLRKGTLFRMGSDALLTHVEPLAHLKREIAKHRGETIDIARFKTLTGLTRKHAIPLLEHLDGARVTANRGGIRTIL